MTDSAVRITHLPTGIVVSSQNERSQIRNREVGMKVLKSRLYELEMQKRREKLDAVEAGKKEIAFGSQIRSYVLHPYRMVKDHRTKHETGNPDRVLDGDLDDFIKATLVAKAKGTLGQAAARRSRPLARLALRWSDESREAGPGAESSACAGREVCACVRSRSACSRWPRSRGARGAVVPRGRREARSLARWSGRARRAASWQLVYERAVDGEMELFVIPAGGGVARRLTHEPAYDGLPRWTPDGKRIVFTSGRSGTPQLWEIDAEGGRPRRLRANRATEYQADVSPDGRLAFLSNLDGPERLMIQDLRSGAVRELVRHGDNAIFGNPHWSPDGRQIAFSSNWRIGHHIYVVDVATGKAAAHLAAHVGWLRAALQPRRDEGRVREPRLHGRRRVASSSTISASDEEKVLVDWPALNYDPVYSPDGSELAFASNIAGQYAIYRQRLSDGQAWRVTFGPGDARNPDYRPLPGAPSGKGVDDPR